MLLDLSILELIDKAANTINPKYGPITKEKKEQEARAAEQRRKQAEQQARLKPMPETLRPTPEERALFQADVAQQLNEQAARDEMARDRAAVNRELSRPFPSVNPNPKPQGVMDMENAIYGSMYKPQTPPPPPPPKEVSEEQRKFRESFAAKPAAAPAQTTQPVETAPVTPRQPTNEELRAAPLNEEGKRFAGLLDSMGQGDMRGRDQRIGGISVQGENQSIAAQDPSFLSRLGRGALDYFSDPINRKTLAIGMAGLSAQPNRGYQAALQGQIEQIQEQRAVRRSGNATADYLERIGLTEQAELVRQNPSMAADILKSATATTANSAYEKAAGDVRIKDENNLVNEAEAAEFSIRRNEELLRQVRDSQSNYVGRLSTVKTETAAILGNVPGLGDALRSAELTKDWMAKAENTEALNKALQADVFASIRDLGIGARGLDTPAERKFLVAVIAGDVTAQRAALEELLVSKIERSRASVSRYNNRLEAGELDAYQRVMERELSPIIIEDQQQTIEGVSDDDLNAAIARNLGGA